MTKVEKLDLNVLVGQDGGMEKIINRICYIHEFICSKMIAAYPDYKGGYINIYPELHQFIFDKSVIDLHRKPEYDSCGCGVKTLKDPSRSRISTDMVFGTPIPLSMDMGGLTAFTPGYSSVRDCMNSNDRFPQFNLPIQDGPYREWVNVPQQIRSQWLVTDFEEAVGHALDKAISEQKMREDAQHNHNIGNIEDIIKSDLSSAEKAAKIKALLK